MKAVMQQNYAFFRDFDQGSITCLFHREGKPRIDSGKLSEKVHPKTMDKATDFYFSRNSILCHVSLATCNNYILDIFGVIFFTHGLAHT